jgi:hypothetical protein
MGVREGALKLDDKSKTKGEVPKTKTTGGFPNERPTPWQ